MDDQVKSADPSLPFDHTLSLVFLGDAGVGKTSIWNCYAEGCIPPEAIPTIGVDFRTRQVNIGQKIVKIMLWDTAGQEKYHSIAMSYVRKAHGLILVYDVSRAETRDGITKWLERAAQLFGSDRPNPLVLVLGNKTDLPRAVDLEEAKAQFARLNYFYFETCAAKNEGVRLAIDYFTRACYVQAIKEEDRRIAKKTKGIGVVGRIRVLRGDDDEEEEEPLDQPGCPC